ncbi:MAG: hypothetical protein ABIT37_03790 [Luteolibacter sp.]
MSARTEEHRRVFEEDWSAEIYQTGGNPTLGDDGIRRFTIATGPEADLVAVADRDFSGLSHPILVACYSDEQFEDFVWEEALFCSEVRRFRGPIKKQPVPPEGKILLLLPGWDMDPKTKAAVDDWIFVQDRYTCNVAGAFYPRIHRPLAWGVILTACVAFWGLAAWIYLH